MNDPLRVLLKPGRSKPFWVGHPWVFSGAVKEVVGEIGDLGGEALVEDERGNILGAGYYNPHAQIAVRILQHRRSTDLEFSPRPPGDVVRERLLAAVSRRTVLGLPSDDTDGFRLVNAEGDGLSGLIVDRWADVAVVHLGSRGMVALRDVIVSAVSELAGVRAVVVATSDDASRLEAIPVEREVASGTIDGPITIRERGVRYGVDVIGGQKTGFYADQRENRVRFAALCAGESVLDLYSYVGGFGLHAALAGAGSVTAVDSSASAAKSAASNAVLNGVEGQMQVHCADAMNWLKESRALDRSWSRIVCDPPKFARGRKHAAEAIKKYARLNTLALSALEPGGLMLTCSCSQHVSDADFLRMLTDAGHRGRHSVQVHEVWTQGADHPFSAVAPEGRYLTAVLLSRGV
jgi:23S rRNA (cytosine1962-C5)-methyltransferase